MPSLSDTIKATDNAIKNVHQKIAVMDTESEFFLKWSKSLYYLVERRALLLTYNEEMVQRIEEVNAEINQKIEELEGERGKRIASICHEFEDKTAELPVIEVVVVENDSEQKETSIPSETAGSTVEKVKKYVKKYLDDYQHIPKKDNLFHAAACSFFIKYIDTDDESCIQRHVNELLSKANILPGTQYPMSLADVDRIISLMNDEENAFFILDTSLRVILTNLTNVTNFDDFNPYFLIYDSESKCFAPTPVTNNSCKDICFNCSRYGCTEHCTRPRTCPICLRTGEEFRCFKPFPESEPLICSKCNAFCQTTDCYDEHSRICPLPIQPIHDSVLQLIKSIICS